MEENNFEQQENNVEDLVKEEVVEVPVTETHVEQVAEENNIEASIAEVSEPVSAITTDNFAQSTAEVQSLGAVTNGIIGVTQTPRSTPKVSNKKADSVEKVAVFSTKNISVPGLGKVYRGYNIVSKDAADQWATKSYIRIATPEEVAKEFGN